MDLDEWDLLSDEGFLDFNESVANNTTTTTTVIDMNYFHKFSQPNKDLNSRVILPIQFEYHDEKSDENPQKIESLKVDDHDNHDDHDDHGMKDGPDYQEQVSSQVFFKKLKENEFVDMKLDQPRSLNRGILPQIDVGSFQFDEKLKKNDENPQKIESLHDDDLDHDDHDGVDDDDEGLNVWKLAMTGIGALFSFGFAAVTVSLIVLGNRNKVVNNSKKQQLHFQFYPHDKRLKQVVRRETTRFNEAIAMMRGAPVTRAHITIGGYYEGL